MKTHSMKTCRAGLLASMVLLGALGGCASPLLPMPAAAPAQFTLSAEGDGMSPEPAPSATPVHARATLVVNRPRATAGYDTVQIAYVRRPSQIEYFAQSEWVDTPSNMLAPMMVRAIERTGAFHAVMAVPTSAAGQWRLESELVRLQQDFSGTPSQVRLTLRAALLDADTRRVIATQEFDARVDAPKDDPYGGVIAAQQAANKVLAALAAFCASAAAR